MTTTLVLGASGATGKKLVEQLLQMDQKVKVIVRPTANTPETWHSDSRIDMIKAAINELTIEELSAHLTDCQAVASCLGHNPTLNGIFGKPRKLVTDAVKLACQAIEAGQAKNPVKFVLMNTTGNRNGDLPEKRGFIVKLVLGLMRSLVPPVSDNEQAAEYLRAQVGQVNEKINWVAVRPDSLIEEDEVSDYEVFASPVRNPITNPGKTSRINVGNFMARLITEKDLWSEWQGQMPVIYNKEI